MIQVKEAGDTRQEKQVHELGGTGKCRDQEWEVLELLRYFKGNEDLRIYG